MNHNLSPPPLLGLSQRQPPHNLQAEQALLGALLCNNQATYERIDSFLRPEHFADPINGRIYDAAVRRIEAGRIADAVTLKAEFENSGVLDEVGGTAYLAQLLTAMVGILNAGEYGQAIYDAWIRRKLIDIGETMVNSAFGSDGELDGSSQVDLAEQALFALTDSSGAGNREAVTVADALRAAVQEGERVRRGEAEAFVGTGLPSLDRAILGLRSGHLLVAAGRPGIGKSALAKTIAINRAAGLGQSAAGEIFDDPSLGSPVAFFLLEEQHTDFGAAMAAQLARVQIAQVLSGDVSVDEASRLVKAQHRLEGTPLFLFDKPRQSLREIARQSRRLKRKHGKLGLIVVDYLQLMPDPTGIKEKRLAVGANAYGLKDIAKELDCPVLLLSQLARRVEERTDKRPTMSDLRESGEIEDAADAIMLLFREEYYYRQTSPKLENDDLPDQCSSAQDKWDDGLRKIAGRAEIIIPKVRRAQATTVQMRFNGPNLRFEEPGL